MRPSSLPCWIYRSTRQQEMYLYLHEKDDFAQVPQTLLEYFGAPQMVMQLDLHPTRKLAREEVSKVMENLLSQGFHLQLPPDIQTHLDAGEQRF